MTSRRLQRIIRSRWWVLALAGILSILAAVLVTQSRNRAIPQHIAVAPITYNRLLGEQDDELARDRLATANDIATDVNAQEIATGIDPLSSGAPAEIVELPNELTLEFIARGATPEEAVETATRMRDRYLAAQQLDSSQELQERIADTTEQLGAVISAIAAATPQLTNEESARLAELQAEVDAYASLYRQFTQEQLNPQDPPRPANAVQADRDAASDGLRAAQDELRLLEVELGVGGVDSPELAVLRAQEGQLRSALDTYVAQSIVEEAIGEVGEVEVGETGIPPTPLPVAAVGGLLVGLLIGTAGLVVVDRIRQPLWEATELEPRYRLPEVAARPRKYGDTASKPWYENAPHGLRKAGIQQLRSHVEGLPGFGQGLVVGLASMPGTSPGVHELAADLAAGLTSSGSWALLIDADFGNPSTLPEYGASDLELEAVVADPHGTLAEAVRRADRDTELLGVSIRERDVDAADLLAKPAFARMLDIAQELYDVVIVACPPTDSPSYHVLSQRLDAMILATVAGDLVPSDVVNEFHTLEERRAFPAGVVLVRPRVGPLSLIMRGLDETASVSEPPRYSGQAWQWADRETSRRKGPRAPQQAAAAPEVWNWAEMEAASERATDPASEPVPAPAPAAPGVPETVDAAEEDEYEDEDERAAMVGEPSGRSERITRRATTKKPSRQPPARQAPTPVAESPWSARRTPD